MGIATRSGSCGETLSLSDWGFFKASGHGFVLLCTAPPTVFGTLYALNKCLSK